jgi:hypothetical protein
MEKIKVKLPTEVSSYIEGLFTRDDYLRSLLFLVLSNENSSEEDVDYYLKKTLLSTMELEIAKTDLVKEYNPDSSYNNFYMEFENKSVVFYKN